MTNALLTMVVVGLYILFTVPFLVLLLFVHRLRSDYTRVFMAAMILQLIPIGLIFFPLGFIGVGLLGYSSWATGRRNSAFRRAGLPNPGVQRRWALEYMANLVAFGFSLEQKAAAFLFIDVTSRQWSPVAWPALAGLSLVIWGLLGPWLWREYRRLPVVAPITEA